MAVDRHTGCGVLSKLMTPLDVGWRAVLALQQLYELTCYWWSVWWWGGNTRRTNGGHEVEPNSFSALPAWLIGLSTWHKTHHSKLISCSNPHSLSFIWCQTSYTFQSFLKTLKLTRVICYPGGCLHMEIYIHETQGQLSAFKPGNKSEHQPL